MPPSSMTGAEFLARVRETPAWARIPVVIVSGLGDVVNPDLLESLRVHASLAKPVNAQQLIRVVREALGDA
jgi:response regulator RpfG family c-di-GMP phosphodiesterase